MHVLSIAASIAHLDRRKIEAALPRTPKKDKNIWRKPSSRKLNRNKWQKYRQWRKGYKAWVEWRAPKPTGRLHFLWIFKYKHQAMYWLNRLYIQIIQPTLINKKREKYPLAWVNEAVLYQSPKQWGRLTLPRSPSSCSTFLSSWSHRGWTEKR